LAVARDLRVKLRVPVVQVEVATYLIEERDLAGYTAGRASARPPPGSYKYFQTFLDHLLSPSGYVGTESIVCHPCIVPSHSRGEPMTFPTNVKS
jgi:hypothetical protein